MQLWLNLWNFSKYIFEKCLRWLFARVPSRASPSMVRKFTVLQAIIKQHKVLTFLVLRRGVLQILNLVLFLFALDL